MPECFSRAVLSKMSEDMWNSWRYGRVDQQRSRKHELGGKIKILELLYPREEKIKEKTK